MNPDLLNWLDNNKMCFNIIDEDVIEITGFGKMYYEDTSMIKSIFRTDADNNIKFNTMENIQTLQEEGINYIVFQFGDNWYYYDTRKDFEFQSIKRYCFILSPAFCWLFSDSDKAKHGSQAEHHWQRDQ